MKVLQRLYVCVLVVASVAFAGPSLARDNNSFRLIKLDGGYLKWGDGRLGTPAEVTIAFADRAVHIPGARNCRVMNGIQKLSATAGFSLGVIRAELEKAMRMWTQVAAIRFRFTRAEDADILVGTQVKPRGRAFANVEYTTAQEMASMVRPASAGGSDVRETGQDVPVHRMDRAQICLNPVQKWDVGFDGNRASYDLRYTFAHEIGHAIGLNHPGRRGSLMASRYEETFRELRAGDIAGVQRLYGPPRSF